MRPLESAPAQLSPKVATDPGVVVPVVLPVVEAVLVLAFCPTREDRGVNESELLMPPTPMAAATEA